MWTEREKILSSSSEIKAYVDEMYSFHDYRLGGVKLNIETIDIFVETDMHNRANEGAYIWKFTFEKITDLKIDMDSVLPPYISEIEIEEDYFMFSLTNGYISFKANGAMLGIPKQL